MHRIFNSKQDRFAVNNELLEISAELKRCREAKGLSVNELANRTKISANFVENFENGQFQFLPEVYIRAFLKTIALEVGLDTEVILRQYANAVHKPAQQKAKVTLKPSMEKHEPKQPPPVKKKELHTIIESIEKPLEKIKIEPPQFINDLKNISLDSKKTGPLIIGAVGIILLLFIFFALPKNEKKIKAESPELPQTIQNIPSVEQGSQSKKAEVQTLTVKALQNTWLRIVFDDSVADEATFNPGDIRSWQSHDKFYLRIGNVGGVELILNGKNLGPPGQGPQIANLKVDENGITSLSNAELPEVLKPAVNP
jgi:transcriptional regulator with XRE-family HTH domain